MRLEIKMSPRTRANAKPPATDVLIPEKLYFRIGEVSRLCNLPAYVLRFWETEFPQLKPVKIQAWHHRRYRSRPWRLRKNRAIRNQPSDWRLRISR